MRVIKTTLNNGVYKKSDKFHYERSEETPIRNECEEYYSLQLGLRFLVALILGMTFRRFYAMRINLIILLIFCSMATSTYGVVFTDDINRKVEIGDKPKRIVALNASNLEILLAFGANVIGRPDRSALPDALYESVKEIPSIGRTSNPSIEGIVSLRPDLVIGNAVGFHQSLIPALEEAGIKVLLLSIKDYEDIFTKLRLYGLLLREPDNAQRLINKIKGRVNIVKASINSIRSKKALIIWGSPQSFSMALPTSFVGSLFRELGIKNVAEGVKATEGSNYVPLSLEYALKQDPDGIFIVTMGDPGRMRDKAKRELEKNEAWSTFRAVKEGRVYYLPYELFTINPSIRVSEAMQYIVNLLKNDQGQARR